MAGNSLSVDSIQLDLSDVSALQDEARSVAFLDARAKAGQYAALSDATLGPVLSVVEGSVAGGGPRPMMRMAMASADSAMPVEAGEQSVSATVTVTWALDGSSVTDSESTRVWIGPMVRLRAGIVASPVSLEETWLQPS